MLTSCSEGEQPSLKSEKPFSITSAKAKPFVPNVVDTTIVPATAVSVDDRGLNVTWALQSSSYASNGGTIITVKMTNNNDVILPADVLAPPLLFLNDGTEVPLLDAASAGIAGQDGLDLPLGAHATTNLRYAFDTAPGNLWNAAFEIGNVRFEGNLSA